MKKNKQIVLSSSILSGLIHAGLLMFLIVCWKRASLEDLVMIPGEKNTIMASVIFNTTPEATSQQHFINKAEMIAKPKLELKPINKPINKPIDKPIDKPVLTQKSDIKKIEDPRSQLNKLYSAEKPTIKAVSGEKLNELNALIYRDISAHKIYPEMAQELNQTGVVTVTFTLEPSGEIKGLVIINSSGYEDLDQAAQEAVLSAQPFAGIEKYLNTEQSFRLNIEFQN